MKWYVLLIFSASAYAQVTLPQLIESALKNDRIQALQQQTRAAELNHQSVERSYLPRIDGFGNAAFVDRTAGFGARQTYTAGARAEVTLFDGFKRSHRLNEKNALKRAAYHSTEEEKKQISLRVISRYLDYENLQERIATLHTLKKRLDEQTKRLEKFYAAGLASEDLLLRIKAEEANAEYGLEDLKFILKQTASDLELLSSLPIDSLEPSRIKEPIVGTFYERDALKALAYERDASLSLAQQATSSYLPNITLEDTYTYYDYRHDTASFLRVDHQNTVQLSLRMNLIDFSLASLEKESYMAQAQARSSELAFASKEQREAYKLSIEAIERSKSMIANAQLSHKAALKTYDAIQRKFEAGIVDHVVYLDALHALKDSEDQLNRAVRTLSYDYAAYYYHAGLDPKDYVQ